MFFLAYHEMRQGLQPWVGYTCSSLRCGFGEDIQHLLGGRSYIYIIHLPDNVYSFTK